jgi:hypothetical protein
MYRRKNTTWHSQFSELAGETSVCEQRHEATDSLQKAKIPDCFIVRPIPHWNGIHWGNAAISLIEEDKSKIGAYVSRFDQTNMSENCVKMQTAAAIRSNWGRVNFGSKNNVSNDSSAVE